MIFKKKQNWHPSDGMIRDCYYEVPEDQMLRYRSLTPYQRLKWLDEVRQITLLARFNLMQKHAS